MSRSDAPRGIVAPVRRATTKRTVAAMTSRSVAAHNGGTASLPMRMAGKVEPQIAHQPRNAAYGPHSVRAGSAARVLVVLEPPTIERSGHIHPEPGYNPATSSLRGAL